MSEEDRKALEEATFEVDELGDEELEEVAGGDNFICPNFFACRDA